MLIKSICLFFFSSSASNYCNNTKSHKTSVFATAIKLQLFCFIAWANSVTENQLNYRWWRPSKSHHMEIHMLWHCISMWQNTGIRPQNNQGTLHYFSLQLTSSISILISCYRRHSNHSKTPSVEEPFFTLSYSVSWAGTDRAKSSTNF